MSHIEVGHYASSLPESESDAFLAELTHSERLKLQAYWPFWARSEQLPPDGLWRTWLICAGRGFGKTRAGAEWVRHIAEDEPEARIALVARSIGEARAVMVEGESGILACHYGDTHPHFEPSLRRLTWPNGAQAMLYSASEPESLRGPQHSHAWCDEIAKWDNSSSRAMAAWDNLQLGLRLGEHPQVLATTTPRAVPLMRRLAGDGTDPDLVVTRGTTSANRAHLPVEFIRAMESLYGSTALGRQELQGELLEDVEGALQAAKARKLADDAAERAAWSQDRLAYRVAELDPALGPGQVVSVPGRSGKWRIEAWEWRENGVELELLRLPYLRAAEAAADAGRSLVPRDAVSGPTLLHAFELPWDGTGSADQRQLFAAASSATSGWTGATLFAERNGSLVPIGGTGTRRSVTGQTATALAPSAALFIDRQASVEVILDAPDFVLQDATPEDVANGSNRALIGAEIVQFTSAEALGAGQWRLSGLLRGRGGGEHLAGIPVPAGTRFTLLDSKPLALSASEVGESQVIAAIGLADTQPALAPIAGLGSSLRPLAPVRGQAKINGAAELELCWIRRARGGWSWQGTVEVPLNEQVESYEVGIGDPAAPVMAWDVPTPSLIIGAAELAQLQADHPAQPIWVRQVGSYSRSPALFLTTTTS